ncbi:MAG: gliding motility-associated C-terminal domain-containing protein [Bacteroidales bacterium]|nr:gliding motility-associated C-terminal domain-containing protein [Bacteroidales bacterium]
MKKITLLVLFLLPVIAYSQLNIVITNNIEPLYVSDGDTLSACRDSIIIFEAEVTGGVEPYEYFWDFDNGTESGIGKDSVTREYDEGRGYRVKLKVVDANSDEGFIIQAIKVAIPPNFSQTKVDIPEEQNGICKGSLTPLIGKAYPELWEDEPFVYEIIEDTEDIDDETPYSSSLTFDEFPLGSIYASGDIDSIGLSIIHSNMGNLKVSLSCEDGTPVVLKDFDATNNTVLGDTANNTPYLYYWSASSTLGTMNSNTILNNGSVYQPDESFDNFIGCSLNGNWTITIEDNQALDSGYVHSWSMIFQEDVLPDVWTFKDTLVQYKIIDDVIYGTYWSGENIDVTGGINYSGDTILHTVHAAPDVPGPNGYNFHVINNFGCPQETKNTLNVEKATFTVKPEGGEAKLDVTFTNETSWAQERDWEFGDGSPKELVLDSDSIIHKYLEGDKTYESILIVTDESGCTDTDTIFIEVLIEPSHLQNVPNMFSPNGDEINDVYKFTEDIVKGMEEFHMTIYSRWGEKVYETYDMNHIINEGWNGKIMILGENNKGPLAAPGIYFYVIEAKGKGKDGDTYIGNRGKEKIKIGEETDIINHPEETKGIIHLFR